jgi:hypothetical protein
MTFGQAVVFAVFPWLHFEVSREERKVREGKTLRSYIHPVRPSNASAP